MNNYKELVKYLRDEAEAVQAIEWEIPICTSNHINQAADVIEQLVKERDAAVMDLKAYSDCDNCKHNTYDNLGNGFCRECSVVHKTKYKWQWRGAQDDIHDG